MYENTNADAAEVRPLFYGLWAFATATRGGAVLLRVTTLASNNPYIKAWAMKVRGSRAGHQPPPPHPHPLAARA